MELVYLPKHRSAVLNPDLRPQLSKDSSSDDIKFSEFFTRMTDRQLTEMFLLV